MTLNNVLKKIKFYLGYIGYWLITIHERNDYLMAQQRGYDVVDSHNDSYILYGSVRKYYFDKSKPPTRRYLTFKQYKKINYPCK